MTVIGRAIPLFHVSDAVKAERFYCDLLGFTFRGGYRPDPASADPGYLALTRDEAEIHLSAFSGDGVAGGVAVLIVEDVDTLHRELVDRGVAIHLPPTDQTWGGREMYVKDPDGNALRFQMWPSSAA